MEDVPHPKHLRGKGADIKGHGHESCYLLKSRAVGLCQKIGDGEKLETMKGNCEEKTGDYKAKCAAKWIGDDPIKSFRLNGSTDP